MGEEGTTIAINNNNNGGDSGGVKKNPKLTVLPLIALIFYDVSGGPFGVEDSVKCGGGPLLSLLGFLVFPFIWSVPEALVTAELSTSFPENGGYVLWISSAFGPFWGFQEGFWKWFSGVMDNALYPVLFLDYLRRSVPVLDRSGPARLPALLGITVSLTYLNYRGLHIVGLSAVLLAVFSLCPFVVMGVLSVPRLDPGQWLAVDWEKVDWRGYFNTLFWNLNYWDKASTLAGEVRDPSRTFPRALLGAVLLVVSSYLLPLLAATGALGSDSGEWSDGYFAEAGFLIGGFWLKLWIQAAAAMSNMGLFEAEMSSDTFQLLGMSEIGMLPAIFASRSKYGTPTVGILCSGLGVVLFSWMSFQEILEFLNFLYSLGMLLEFAAFIWLRIKKPDLHRPYKVPVQTFGAIMICVPPALLLVLVMCLASLRTFLVSGAVLVFGFLLYPILVLVKAKGLMEFCPEKPSESPPGISTESESMLPQEDREVEDEASVSLLLDSSAKTGQESSGILPEGVQRLK